MKRAICIGINAYPAGNDLSGCVNDAFDWRDLLDSRGFSTIMLADRDATKANIVKLLQDGMNEAKHGDTLVVTYSGHGTNVPDLNGDEPDAADEAICPIDIFNDWKNVLTDDELYEIFSVRERGVRLMFISDSCNSGTVSRFMPAPAGAKLPRVRFLPARAFMPADVAVAPVMPLRRTVSKLVSSALLFAGCKDTEYSYDAWFGDRPNGAFTRAAIDAYRDMIAAGIREPLAKTLFGHIRTTLPNQAYPQTPQLFGTSAQKKWIVF